MIQHVEFHLLPRWVLQSLLNVSHTSSNPLQRAKSSRGMAAVGCDFWSADALWHLEGFRREHTDTKDKVASKVGTPLSSPCQWPPIFLKEPSVMPDMMSLSHLSCPMLNSSPLHHSFPSLSWNYCVEGLSQLKLSRNERWVRKRWHYTHSRVTASALTHSAITVVTVTATSQTATAGPWLQFLLHWDQRRTSSQNCTTSISWVLSPLCQALVPSIAPRHL